MFYVSHKRYRDPNLSEPWLSEDEFRYWADRRGVLKRRGDLIHVGEHISPGFRLRFEIWRDRAAFEQFRDDICARVIESVIKHEESLRGVRHETIFSEE
jgi:hypothetical protein